LGDSVDAYFPNLASVQPQIQAGRLRILGVVHRNRFASLPDVPTLPELGIPVEMASWYGILAPAQAPAGLLDRINADCRKAMDSPVIKSQLSRFGIEYTAASRQQFWAIVREADEHAAKLIANRKLVLE
jgi:tripartite-type tricarboxylate transporter receptor subunit TctC